MSGGSCQRITKGTAIMLEGYPVAFIDEDCGYATIILGINNTITIPVDMIEKLYEVIYDSSVTTKIGEDNE